MGNDEWKYIIIERRSKKMKRYGFGKLLFDVIMTIITGGFWLIIILIKFFRTH